MGLYDFTFYDLVNRNMSSFGNREAWFEVDDGRSLSFRDYKYKVDCLASGLQKEGLKKGDRIGVVGKNSLEFFMIYGAAAAVGAIVVPINWRLSSEEVAFNLNDCEPVVIFADKEFQGNIKDKKNKVKSARKLFNLALNEGEFDDFENLTKHGAGFNPVEVSSDDGFVIIHTAAVEGRPRGGLLSHGNVMLADMHFMGLCGLNSKDVHLNLLPLFHVGGLFTAMASFHAGAVNINLSKFDAAQAVNLINDKHVSFMMVFSPILASILDEHEKSGLDLGSLKAVTGLESPETIERYQRITGGTFYCMYGQTETSCLATFSPYNEKPGSAGRTLPLAEVRLVDDYGDEVPAGQQGEIVMKGPMVFKGYWNLPKDSAHTFRDGWHHTGDMGRFDEDGFLFYTGRKPEKELIKPGGENVYPAEVEKVILEHPAVEKTVVFGVPDPKWKEGIKAVCVLRQGEELGEQDLIDFVGERIARYKKPQYVEFVSDFPADKDGSPDRAKIKEMYGG
jgi:long-chain acyl-CoA synthetase